MSGEGQVNDMRYPEPWNYSPLWRATNRFSRNQALGNNDRSLTRFRLLFIVPAGSKDPGIPLVVSDLHLYNSHIGYKWL